MKTFVKVWLGIGFIAMGVGIALMVIAAASGAKWEDVSNLTNMHGSYEDVESVNFDLNYGEFRIMRGDNFSISAENVLEDQIKSYVEDGIWYITEDKSKNINVFGIRLPSVPDFNFGFNDKHYGPVITITIPEGFSADNFKIDVSAGSVYAEEINASEGEFHVEAGQLKIKSLKVSKKSSYSVGLGELSVEDTNVNDVDINCGTGSIRIKGIITGDNQMKCGIGNIELSLNGDKEDYSYKVNAGLGNVKIDGDSYNSISNEIIHNEEAEHSLDLDCGVGSISVEFY